ncbi:MAG: glycosyltransferase family 2 protein [Acidobacteria bacterium]|nr:glycosyltransferase family 2 protein [Acidobacteriota bacterium]
MLAVAETTPKIAVLLSTFNGEKYIADQLDSLLEQTYKNLLVLLRDDGSGDGTAGILQTYHDRHPDRFHRILSGGHKLGAGGSYSFLMQYALKHKQALGLEKAYMMFCDQDDIWAEDKIELQMRAMQSAESGDAHRPVLVHSDLRVVSESRDVIADSFLRFQGLVAERNGFGQLLLCNIVTGCTALINEPLAVLSVPVPPEAVMHDWWLALAASAFGKMILVGRPLVDYRQHGANTLGAVEYKANERTFLEMVRRIPHMKPEPLLNEVSIQAKAFLARYRAQLTASQKLRLRFTSAMFVRSGVLQRALFRVLRKL